MTYARTAYPKKKEQKETPKNQLRSAPTGMKCCAAFQTRACEHTRDHHPHTCLQLLPQDNQHISEAGRGRLLQENSTGDKKREKEGAIVLPLKHVSALAPRVQGQGTGQAPTPRMEKNRNIVQDTIGEVRPDVSTERADIHCNEGGEQADIGANNTRMKSIYDRVAFTGEFNYVRQGTSAQRAESGRVEKIPGRL